MAKNVLNMDDGILEQSLHLNTYVFKHVDKHPDVEGDAWPGPGVEGVQEDHLGLVHSPAEVDAGKQVAAVQLQVQHVLTSLLYIETLAVM